MNNRYAMTLVEVLFSLIIITTAVLSAVMLLPIGVKAVEQSRFQMYAAMKATELMDLFSQSRKNWSNNDMEINNGNYVGASIRLESNGFAPRAMPDLEQVLLRDSGSAYPVPMEIAKRLDSPGDMIQSVIADGGLLFYPDPFPTRDGLRQSVRFGSLTSPIPELQKLVFAVVTPAQQNALPNHPAVAWPYYEMFPFPPQTKVYLPSWTYTAARCPSYVHANGNTYTLTWTGPTKTSGSSNDRYQGSNWAYMAATYPTSVWGASLTNFSNLSRYGYTPLWFKESYETGTVSYNTSTVQSDGLSPTVSNNTDSDLPPKPGGPSGHWRGTRIQEPEQDPNYFASVPADVEAARVAMNAAYPATPYEFDKEINMRLPSLGMRRFYRQLALILWQSVDTGGLGNPLTTDLTSAPNTALHPARILALSYLADAAMTVTGYQLPYINTRNDVDTTNDVDLNTTGALTDDNATYKGPGSHRVLNQFAGSQNEANADGTLKAGAAPTADEITMAQRVHENLMNWTMRYSSLFPYDMNVPRPANRQMFMDRPLLSWDLFDASGNAVRTPTNYTIPVSLTDYSNASKNNWAESFYPVLQPPGYTSSGGAYAGFDRFFGFGTDDAVGDLGLSSNWRSAYDKLKGTQNARWWFDQPFAPSHRTRLLVFWAVDWKSYEDSESTPSAPMDASVWSDAPAGDTVAPEDIPEAAIVWTNANRNARNNGDSSTGAHNAHQQSYWYGQFGADRNGNGVFDQGRMPASTRMRATEVARFVFYDPVTYRALRR